MKKFLKVMWAEACKQHRNYFNNKLIYISLFVWPLLSFITAYYSYKSFEVDSCLVEYINAKNIMIFLLLGFMGMSFFRSVVQCAWHFSFERQSGTLEYIYLSPANRMAVLLGNALSSVIESSVVMFVFGLLMLLSQREYLKFRVGSLLLVLIIFIVMALLWGTFLNSMFLYSRDTDFLFTILEEPMEIFSGVKMPVSIFPFLGKVVAAIFPLTYALQGLRQTMMEGAKIADLKLFLIQSTVIIVVLLGITLVTIHIVEKHMRKTGNVVLF